MKGNRVLPTQFGTTRSTSLKVLAKASRGIGRSKKRESIVRRASTLLQENVNYVTLALDTHVAKWSRVDWFMGTFRGQMSAICLIGCCMLLMGAVAISSREHSPGEAGPLHHDFLPALWISWTYFVDPGTQTGLAGSDSGVEKAIAVLCSMSGYTFFLSVMGIVVDIIRFKLNTWRVYKSRVVCNRHTLILGWTDKTLCMIEQLAEAMASEGGGTIVVLCDQKRSVSCDEAKEFVDYHFKRNPERPKNSLRGTKVVCWEGEQTNTSDLMKVSVLSASSVIIMSGKGDLHDCDQHVIQTVMCVAGMGKTINGSIVAEVRFIDNKSILERIVPNAIDAGTGIIYPKIKAILTSQIMNRLLVTMAISPVVGYSFVKLLGFYGDDFYMREWPELTGKTFGEIVWLFEHAIPVGINIPAHRSKEGVNLPNQLTLNPSADTVFEKDFQLVVIAADDDSYAPRCDANTMVNHNRLAMQSQQDKGAGASTTAIATTNTNTNTAADTITPVTELIGPNAHMVNALVSVSEPRKKKVVLLFGWRSDIVNILTITNKMLGTVPVVAESEVYILNEVPVNERMVVFEEGGLPTAVLPASDPRAHHGHHSVDMGGMVVHQFFGDSTVRRKINMLPTKHADMILILSNDMIDDSMLSDSNNITTLLLCTDIQASSFVSNAQSAMEKKSLGDGDFKSDFSIGSAEDKKLAKKCVTVCEFSDPRTARIAASNQALHSAALFFPYNELVTQVFAMLSENPHISIVLEHLFAMKGQELLATPITACVTPEELQDSDGMCFWDLALAARKRRHLLIGWYRPREGEKDKAHEEQGCSYSSSADTGNHKGQSATELMEEIEINPMNKSEKRRWKNTDSLLVLGPFEESTMQ